MNVLWMTLALLSFHSSHHCSLVSAKELEVTNEWQVVGENDTIPSGVHVRMDMTTGEKWVKMVDEEENENADNKPQTSMAVIADDGAVSIQNDQQSTNKQKQNEDNPSYDFDMMHRTLSKLPDDEKERFGGLPELPEQEPFSKTRTTVTSEQRKAFEKRMLDIWKQRQAELAELQEQLLDFPAVLKERINSIEAYLKDPPAAWNGIDLETPEGVVTHIVSVLDDLQFQLSDVDMARDFHTMGGWPLLASLVSESDHVPVNQTIHSLSRSNEAKIRTIQALAAEALGTAVKNTEEFFSFAVERIVIDNGSTGTTVVDMMIDVFCKNDYGDDWETKTLLSKAVYAIGAMLRGNRMAQVHVLKHGGFEQLGEKYKSLTAEENSSPTNTKLILRLSSLVSDIVEDVQLHPELGDTGTNQQIINALTTSSWCNATCGAVTSETFLPLKVQESLLHSMAVLSPYCHPWSCTSNKIQSSIERMKSGWQDSKESFDDEHYQEMVDLADAATEAVQRGASEQATTA
jgi:nucleotide exchange factor SIL1